MFVNYYAEDPDGSVVNVAVARLLVAALGVWKLASYDWASITRWDVYATDYYLLLVPEWIQPYLVVEKYLAILGLCLFALGVAHRYVTPATAILVAHLGVARFTLDPSGGTQALFTLVYLLVFFALYRSEDRISVDGLRASGAADLSEVNAVLQSRREDLVPGSGNSILKWGLLTLGVLYFGAGLTKILYGPVWEWATARSLGQYVLWAQSYFGVDSAAGRLLLQYPALLLLAAVGTLVLETGFLPWILAKRDVTPFVVGLVGMHVVIAVVMGPFFFDQIVFLLLFADWSRLLSRLESDATLDLVYDDRCRLCARSLFVFALMDVNDTVAFHSPDTAPAAYADRPGVDFETALYAFRDGESYEGYDALRELFAHLGVFAPLAVAMSLPIVRRVGERTYAYVAANRDRHFTCSGGPDADD